ncbi:putative peptidoglycan D,D-transpeptidase FtsI [bacterium MnTg02]|nr:putative peptidoglycan D,D-transpeptidase FtsI [bacterium MnTg02]
MTGTIRPPHDQPGSRATIRRRIALAFIAFTTVFGLIGGRLVDLAFTPVRLHTSAVATPLSQTQPRPDVVDRHGRLLATDIPTTSVFADPKRIVDVDEAVENLSSVLKGLNSKSLLKKLANKKRRFVWIKRGLTPEKHEQVMDLGLPGIEFISEPRRVYPTGATASHILGYVDIDNRGRAGIERYIDSIAGVYFPKTLQKAERPIVKLSIDLGVQHILRNELDRAMKTYRAKAAAGIVLDVTSGEVVAMSSLPDFDPNHPKQALHETRFDRVTNGTYELGSVFKTVTVAMALDLGTVTLDQGYDVTKPIEVGGFTIDDYHPLRRWLSIPEIFIHSSNIGAAKMAEDVGIDRHRAFLKKIGLLDPMTTELGKVRKPQTPKSWKLVNSMTVAYGHGLSVAPLQFAAASAALVNGGYKITPTFLYQSQKTGLSRDKKVLKSETSAIIRELLRRNVKEGTGRRSDVIGYRVGGKTGTAEKVIKGKYSKTKLRTSFLSVFPSDDPAYVLLVMIDEPKPAAEEQQKRPTAGMNAAPLTARIISRIAAKLGVMPDITLHAGFDDPAPATY